jgi:ribose transport system permease protein
MASMSSSTVSDQVKELLREQGIIKRIVTLLERNGLLVGFVLLCVGIGLLSPNFLTARNFINILRQVSINGVVAIGQTFVIITGGIDLSIGSGIGLAGILVAKMLPYGTFLAISSALLACLAAGLLNGIIITKLRVTPFVATLGMMAILRGTGYVISGGYSIYETPDIVKFIGQGNVLGIPMLVVVVLGATCIAYYVTKYTVFGRHIFAVGGNDEGARLAGVRVQRTKLWAYTISGLTMGIAGVMLAGRMNTGEPTAGTGYELDCIAAVVIGGTSLSGGQGSVFGTLLGALVLGVVNNGMNILNVNVYWQQVVKGSIIVLAVVIDQFRKR